MAEGYTANGELEEATSYIVKLNAKAAKALGISIRQRVAYEQFLGSEKGKLQADTLNNRHISQTQKKVYAGAATKRSRLGYEIVKCRQDAEFYANQLKLMEFFSTMQRDEAPQYHHSLFLSMTAA